MPNASSYVSAPSYSYDDDVEMTTTYDTYDYSYDSYESLAGVATIGDETAIEIMQAERQLVILSTPKGGWALSASQNHLLQNYTRSADREVMS